MKMEELKQKILKEGMAKDSDILVVNSFLNQQVDTKLMENIGKEFAAYFKDKGVTKILTAESSGIAPALMTAANLGVNCIFARKQKSLTTDDNSYVSTVYSFTKQEMKNLIVEKSFLNEDDKILIIDDFLANGQASKAMIALCNQAGADVVGIGIVIEKSFQEGRKILEEMGYDVYSLARISKLEEGKIEFLD